jgi:preprotein translocase subunit SecB
MTETKETPAQPQAAPQITQRVITQYVRDMSFENYMAQKGVKGEVKPEMQIQVNLDARKRGADNQFEVITKLKVTSNSQPTSEPLFLLEVEYAGVFQIDGLSDEQLLPYLMIECPRITFPFLRRIVSDVTRDGGFPPLNLETIDFVALYRNEIARRLQAQAGTNGAAKTEA